MMIKQVNILPVLAIILLLMQGSDSFGYLQVGDTATDFMLQDSYGNSVSLSDFSGEIILLAFWRRG